MSQETDEIKSQAQALTQTVAVVHKRKSGELEAQLQLNPYSTSGGRPVIGGLGLGVIVDRPKLPG